MTASFAVCEARSYNFVARAGTRAMPASAIGPDTVPYAGRMLWLI
jgi:hypothetical protein